MVMTMVTTCMPRTGRANDRARDGERLRPTAALPIGHGVDVGARLDAHPHRLEHLALLPRQRAAVLAGDGDGDPRRHHQRRGAVSAPDRGVGAGLLVRDCDRVPGPAVERARGAVRPSGTVERVPSTRVLADQSTSNLDLRPDATENRAAIADGRRGSGRRCGTCGQRRRCNGTGAVSWTNVLDGSGIHGTVRRRAGGPWRCGQSSTG